MFDSSTEDHLSGQLLQIARDPELRQLVYARLGEYSHQCRNRLNSLKLCLFLAIRQSTADRSELWDEIDRSYLNLERRVERIQLLCRPLTLTHLPIALDLLIEDRRSTWTRTMAEAGCELAFVAPKDRAVVSYDVPSMGVALDALVAWRAGHSYRGRSARVRWSAENGRAQIYWEEFGEAQGRKGEPDVEGATWSLPLVARIVTAHGGDYRLESTPNWQITLTWPAHPPEDGAAMD